MTYDTIAIDELAEKIARFELPRAYSVSMEDFVVSREKGHGWYPCQYCGSVIERTLEYANRKFTCYQCRRDRQKRYDNSPTRVQKRKERRVRLSAKEKEAVDSWNQKTTPTGIYKRLRRYQKKPI